jgi:hypothetical protein
MPHMGRPVVAITHEGDAICGIMDRVHDGHLVMRPFGNMPEAAIRSIQAAASKQGKKLVQTTAMKKSFRVLGRQIATTKAWGGYPGRPYGWGYGNYGWGFGWWWIFPLFWLAAIAAWGFFW